jgi:hypothetical protein
MPEIPWQLYLISMRYFLYSYIQFLSALIFEYDGCVRTDPTNRKLRKVGYFLRVD